MRCNVWHLHSSVNIVVPTNHSVEPMLPMHCHQWIAVIIVEKKSGMTINGLLHLWRLLVLHNGLKHLRNILSYSNPYFSCLYLYFFNDVCISQVLCNLWSMFTTPFSKSLSFSVRPQNSEIRILYERECTPLRNTYSRPHYHAQTLGTFASVLC